MPGYNGLLEKNGCFKEQKSYQADKHDIKGHQVILHIEAVKLDRIAEAGAESILSPKPAAMEYLDGRCCYHVRQ